MAEGIGTNLEDDKGGGDSLDGVQKKPVSYADRLKTNIKYDQRLKRNVLEIEIEKLDRDNEVDLDQSCVARLLASLGMDARTELKGYKVKYERVVTLSVWCHPGVNLERFCRSESIQVQRGIWTRNIRPAGRRDVVVTVSGLDFNTPDTLVKDYIEKFGGKLFSQDIIYERHGDGPLKGVFNGDRKYNIEFSDTAKPMGTYHFLDGERVRVFYRGNTKTCGRCHEVSGTCVGGGIARDCNSGGGKKVDLADHMRSLWQEIGFSPTSFELPAQAESGATGDSKEGDLIISEEKSFRRQVERPSMNEDDIKKIIGIQIRNLPPTLSSEEVVTFVNENVDKDITLDQINFFKNEHSLNVAIENGLEGNKVVAAAAKLEFRQSRQKYFDKPLYCRILKNLTPEKTPPLQTPTGEKPPCKTLAKDFTTPKSNPLDSTKLSVKEQSKALDKKLKSKPNTILECGLTNTAAQHIKRNHNDIGSPTSPENVKSPKKSKAGTKQNKT